MSDATIALPALTARGMTASFFVCAGRIDSPGYLDKCAIRDIVACGMAVGSHGWAHVNWRQIANDALDQEIDGARQKIADVIDRSVDTIAIPFGSYDRRVLSRLRRSNLKAVYTSDGGRAPAAGWLLPRETFRQSTWDNKILLETHQPSIRHLRRLTIGFVKRWR